MTRALFLDEYVDGGVAMVVNPIFLEVLASPRFFNKPTDEAKVKRLQEKLVPLFTHLDESIGTREFFVGDALTVADIAVASSLIAYRHTGFVVDEALHPNLHRYGEAIIERPTISGIYAAEVAKFAGD